MDATLNQNRLRLSADVGGTFTDVAAFDEPTGRLMLGKTLTTHQRLVTGIEKAGASFPQAQLFLHGTTVAISQMTRYMALAVAPVSVVSPIQRLSMVIRIYFGAILNPHHEVFGGRIIVGTVISLFSALALSVSVDGLVQVLPLPAAMGEILSWNWRFPWP